MTPLRRSLHALVVLEALVLSGCSSGRQTLGREVDGGEYLPGPGGSSYFSKWDHGPPSAPTFFPLMVWMQSPQNAARFQDVGVNFFTGLWEGPTAEQLSGLTAANMPAVCEQSGVWQSHVTDSTTQGWLHDQPDDAQLQSDGRTPVHRTERDRRYAAMTESDPTRPVFMNLGRVSTEMGRPGRSKAVTTCIQRTRRERTLTLVVSVKDGLPLRRLLRADICGYADTKSR
jgi:hypothetical protein